MSDANTPEYYRRREQQERTFAAMARSPAIRAVHLELAERYASLVHDGELERIRAPLIVVGGSHA